MQDPLRKHQRRRKFPALLVVKLRGDRNSRGEEELLETGTRGEGELSKWISERFNGVPSRRWLTGGERASVLRVNDLFILVHVRSLLMKRTRS